MTKLKKRIVFFTVFLIPVIWYVFLQSFGSNEFSLTIIESSENCRVADVVTVYFESDSVSIAKQNYLDRVKFGLNERKVPALQFDTLLRKCHNQNLQQLVLVDEKGLWGTYELSRDGVDRLLTEVDILLLQRKYGKGAYR